LLVLNAKYITNVEYYSKVWSFFNTFIQQGSDIYNVASVFHLK